MHVSKLQVVPICLWQQTHNDYSAVGLHGMASSMANDDHVRRQTIEWHLFSNCL